MYAQLEACIQKQIPVTDHDLKTIVSCFKPLTPQRNETLVSQGQPGQRMFFINRGAVRIYFINEQGQEATRYLAFEGQFATTLLSFITDTPSLEYIQALEQTELVYITRTDFYRLLETIPTWDKFYRHYLEIAYVTNTNRLMSFLTLDAKERYLQLLRESPEAVQRLPNKIVASYLNISQETLSRLKSKV